MSFLDPSAESAAIEKGVLGAFSALFPITGKKHKLVLTGVEVERAAASGDVTGQKDAKLSGKTWGDPVHGSFELQDLAGKTVDKATVRIMTIPKMTGLFSYIVFGKEQQVASMQRLKSGIYSMTKADGTLESQFNLAEGAGFAVTFEPNKRRFQIAQGSSHVNLYPVLKAMGISNQDIERVWGPELAIAGQKAKDGVELPKLAKLLTKKTPKSMEESITLIRGAYDKTKLYPETTEKTVGKPLTKVDGTALLLASKRLLGISRGTEPEDDRDSFEFKELWGLENYLPKRVKDSARTIQTKVFNNLDRKDRIREIVKAKDMSLPISSFFSKTSMAEDADQTNPVSIVSGQRKLTLLSGPGEGGIQSEERVSSSAKAVNATQFGFVDAIPTPEGSKAGITLYLPLGAHKKGLDAVTRAYNTRTGKMEDLTAVEAARSTIGFPDQYTWDKGRPKPVGTFVQVRGKDHRISEVSPKEVDWIFPSSGMLHTLSTNMIPFLQNDHGNRANYASKQISQAIALENPEEPLIQVHTGASDSSLTWEKMIGSLFSHASPVNGVVKEITDDKVEVLGNDGKSRSVQLYRHYPLNDRRSQLNAHAVVKVGDKVSVGQVLADTDYTRGGVLSLGTNLRVAYMPYKNATYEDGIVVSESAAKKLTSKHLYQESLFAGTNVTVDKKRFLARSRDVTVAQGNKLDEHGVVRIGETVNPGDVLVGALKKSDPTREQLLLQGIHKIINRPDKDASLRWDGYGPGVVKGVYKNGELYQVHVETVEPAQAGDKLCYDEETELLTRTGWKRVAEITLLDEICCLVDGHIRYQLPKAVHYYPTGGRMYRLKNQQVDFLVTEDHQMYAKTRGGDRHQLYSAKEVFGKRVRYAKAGKWVGSPDIPVVFPALEVSAGQFGNGTRHLPEFSWPLKTYLMVLGAYLSNGHCEDHQDSGSCGISIDKVSGEQFDALCVALAAAGIDFSRVDGPTCSRVKIYSKQLLEHFKKFGHAQDKFIPEDVFSYSPETLCVLFDWLVWGDGHLKNNRAVNYTTISRRLADDVQRLALHIGIAANVYVQSEEGWQTIRGKRYWCQRAYSVRFVHTRLTPEVNHGHTKTQSVREERWVDDWQGPVYCVTVPGHVIYTRRDGKPAWSGNCGRHGNKGVISAVIPDGEMPCDAKGNPVEIIMNPLSTGGRMNPGQILETALAKVAKAKGSVYAVTNFEGDTKKRIVHVKGHWRTVKTETGAREVWVEPHDRTYFALVQKELKDAGISDRERLFDPKTGEEFRAVDREPGVLVGHQYTLKLEHMASKGLSARGYGEGLSYDVNMAPKGGSDSGAQSMGELGNYALLAHGDPTAVLQEMLTVKSDRTQAAFWSALQSGQMPPAPRVPFAYAKFQALLRVLGVDLDKKGDQLQLMPYTNEQILARSAGELVNPDRVIMGNLKSEKGGIFDERITGGIGGSGQGHISLGESFANPLFEGAIRGLLGLRQKDYAAIVTGEMGIKKNGQLVKAEEADYQAGAAIEYLLKQINVKEDLESTKKKLKTASKSNLDALHKKAKYLQGLDKMGLRPEEAYILKNVLVISPKFRPLTPMDDGNLSISGLNGLYRALGISLKQLKAFPSGLPPEYKNPLRAEVYDALTSLEGLGGRANEDPDHPLTGAINIIAGTRPKTSFFQEELLKRKQDMTMRAVIIPAEGLGLDEVGIPKDAAMELFRPLVVREMVQGGYKPLEAQELLRKKDTVALQALDRVAKSRPVLMKRDPALHKFSVMAFWPKLIGGDVIHMHPLATGGFGADFDGDKCSIYVPVTPQAVEAAKGMLPSRNLFSPATGRVPYTPTMESQFGLFDLSRWGNDAGKKYSSPVDLLKDARQKKIAYQEVVNLNGNKTTAGRVLIDSVLPDAVRTPDFLTHPEMVLDKGHIGALYEKIAKEAPGQFAKAADDLKNLGFDHSFRSGWTVGLSDLVPLREIRAKHFAAADKEIEAAAKTGMKGKELDAFRVHAFGHAKNLMIHDAKKDIHLGNNAYLKMALAGTKPSFEQFGQLVLAPGILDDGKGGAIPVPVRHSFSEGLSAAEYWIAAHGARQGVISKTQEVREPGALNKLVMNTMIGMTITKDDCGSVQGIRVDVGSDALDRFTTSPISLPSGSLSVGTLVTPEMLSALKTAKIDRIDVRSPLKCNADEGICGKCWGVWHNGATPKLREHIGAMAGQSIGERSVQITLKKFHSGGVSSAKQLTGFDRLKQVLNMPNTLPGSATLSTHAGVVSAIKPDPAGGWQVRIADKDHYVPHDRGLNVNVGESVEKGKPISGGVIDPRELLGLTNIETVQNYLTSEMKETFKGEGLQQRNFEVLVRGMTGLGVVENSGDHDEWFRGDVVPVAKVHAWNRENPDKQVQVKPILKGLKTLPLSGTEDWATRMEFQELKDTVAEGSAKGWKSNLHGSSPIPGMIYGAEFGKPPADKPWAF